jgi:RNA-binding motif X-linked protein 2
VNLRLEAATLDPRTLVVATKNPPPLSPDFASPFALNTIFCIAHSYLFRAATMQSVRQIARLNDLELQKCVPPNASWHTDYRDTAYIHIGGLPFELSEGDVLTIFSQYGNPKHLHLVRDKETGKSRGFAFLKYEDQRSCDLAVDNLSGAGVLGRVLGVDHCRYQLKDGEVEGQGMEEDALDDGGDETDREGEVRKKRRRKSESESEEEEERRPLLKEEAELAKLLREHDEDDPMKSFLVQEKKDEVAEALKRLEVSKKDGKGHDRSGEKKRRHHRSRRHGSDDEDGEKKKERHRSRRDGEKDDGKSDRLRSRRVEQGDERSDQHRSRKHRDDEGRRDDRQRADRNRPSDDEHDRGRDDRKNRGDQSMNRKSGRREPDDHERRGTSRDRPLRD